MWALEPVQPMSDPPVEFSSEMWDTEREKTEHDLPCSEVMGWGQIPSLPLLAATWDILKGEKQSMIFFAQGWNLNSYFL